MQRSLVILRLKRSKKVPMGNTPKPKKPSPMVKALASCMDCSGHFKEQWSTNIMLAIMIHITGYVGREYLM